MKDTGSFNVAIPTLDSREAYSGPFYEEKQHAGVEGGYHVVPREDTFLDLVILNLAWLKKNKTKNQKNKTEWPNLLIFRYI